MLELALRAGIPVIACSTTDIVNLPEVLSAYSPNPVKPLDVSRVSKMDFNTTYYVVGEDRDVSKETYDSLVKKGCSLILVNCDPSKYAFEVGYLFPPKTLMAEFLGGVVPEDQIDPYLRVVSGLTIKQMVEVIQLTQARYGKMTPALIMSTRAMVVGSAQGLNQVPVSEGDFYSADPTLRNWVKSNRSFFLNAPDKRLIPRGLLFEGYPGVGKTQGAKYIARKFGVPLYRLDLSGSLGKYVGESEANLARVLNLIDNEEPCVLLIDEVEKIFTAKEDTGVTSRLLGQLLWWLQEHTSRVLTIMTTNAIEVLPRELYRPGRIDKVITLQPLNYAKATAFAEQVLGTFSLGLTKDEVMPVVSAEILASTDPQTRLISHAEVVACVHTAIKAITKKE